MQIVIIMRPFLILFMLLGTILNAQEQLIRSHEAEDQKEPCLQTITGQIRDQMTSELISNAIVSLTDKEGNPIQTLMVTEDATFTFKVECEGTYKLMATKETYNPQSKLFTTSKDAGLELMTKIFLDQGRIDFIYDPAEKAKTTSSSEVVTNTKIESGELQKPVLLNNNIKEVAKEEQPEPKEEKKVIAKKIMPSKNKITAGENVMVLKPVIFDYESSYLNQQAKKDLIKVVDLMKKNPGLIIECASYTDAKGSEKYNLWMSERRAKRTVEYIVRRGINPQRISGKGYGEAKLINDCTEGQDCTDEQRAVNRRTEFKIVKE